MSDFPPVPGGSRADHEAIRNMQAVSADITTRINLALNPPDQPEQLAAAIPNVDNLAANLIAVGEHLITVADTLAGEIAARAEIHPDQLAQPVGTTVRRRGRR